MPETFPNPYNYSSPIGDALANLTATMFKAPSQAARIKSAEEALKLKREREGLTSVADVFSQYGQPGFDRKALAAGAVLGGYDPQDIGDMERWLSANTFGATDPRTDNAFVGAGGAYSSTGGGFSRALAETARANDLASADRRYNTDQSFGLEKYKFDSAPETYVDPTTRQPVIGRRENAYGNRPVLSETDAKGFNLDTLFNQPQTFDDRFSAAPAGVQPIRDPASASSVKMYRTQQGQQGRTVDGMTDMVTGAAIPADAQVGSISDTSETFGNTELAKTRTDLIARRSGVESMVRQATNLDQLLSQADAGAAIGILGSGARIANDIASQVEAALQLSGVDAPAQLRDIRAYENTFRELGVTNAELQSSLMDLAYATAQAREPGRLTEADIDRALRTIGGNLQDPLAMRRVLRAAVDRAKTDYEAFESIARGAYGDALNLPGVSLSSLAPFDGTAPATGRVQVTDEASYNAVPPGAQYVDPHGNIRTKGR